MSNPAPLLDDIHRAKSNGMNTSQSRRPVMGQWAITRHRFGPRRAESCVRFVSGSEEESENGRTKEISSWSTHAFPHPLQNLIPSPTIRLQKGLAVLGGFLIFLGILWMCNQTP
jgi:hypothetical protein